MNRESVLNKIKLALIEAGNNNVYLNYGNIDESNIDNDVAITITPIHYEEMTSVFDNNIVYTPFKLEFEIHLIFTKEHSFSDIYEYYETKVIPAMLGISGTTYHMIKMNLKYEHEHLVLKSLLQLYGVGKD